MIEADVRRRAEANCGGVGSVSDERGRPSEVNTWVDAAADSSSPSSCSTGKLTSTGFRMPGPTSCGTGTVWSSGRGTRAVTRRLGIL